MVNNFIFYANWLDAIKHLNNREQENELLRQIVEYGTSGEVEVCGDGAINMAFSMIKPQIDNMKMKYEAKINGGQTAGRKKVVDDDQVRGLAQQGMKAAEIADLLGVSTTTVYHSDGWKYRNL